MNHSRQKDRRNGNPGYFNPGYMSSLSEFGEPILLPRSGASILRRVIGESEYSDGMGGYPLFCCPEWSGLDMDLEDLRESLVSIVMVPDPMSSPSREDLSKIFPYMRPYKKHYFVTTDKRPQLYVKPRHRDHALKALRHIEVEVCNEPWKLAGEFNELFSTLATRHNIRGLRRFSKRAFELQFKLPGLIAFRAITGNKTIGIDTWYVQDNCAQGHLSALSSIAYNMHAAYAIKWSIIEYFSDKVQYINLGGGRSVEGNDGLSSFKSGWANGSYRSWICGRILQPENYENIVCNRSASSQQYFPAYRWDEYA